MNRQFFLSQIKNQRPKVKGQRSGRASRPACDFRPSTFRPSTSSPRVFLRDLPASAFRFIRKTSPTRFIIAALRPFAAFAPLRFSPNPTQRLPALTLQALCSHPASLPHAPRQRWFRDALVPSSSISTTSSASRADHRKPLPSASTIVPSGQISTSTTYSSTVIASSKSRSPSMNS